MNQYISDTRYAAESLILIMQKENKLLDEKLAELPAYIALKNAEKDLFESMQKNYFTSEGIIEVLGLNSATEKIQKEELQRIRDLLGTTDASLNTIAGALLQISKQGMSYKYAYLKNCPPGRIVGKETLKNIVWQGRNQTMHFEEGNYNQKVIDCFINLELDHGVRFSLGKKSLAYEVVKLLKWTSYSNYESDMKLLLPN